MKAMIIAPLASRNDSTKGMPFTYRLSPISGGLRDDKVVRSSSIFGFWGLGGG